VAEFNIDYLPVDKALTNKDGTLSPAWENYLRSLHNLASNNFNANGTHLPTIDPDALVETPTGAFENGAAYYNTTDNQAEIIINGVRHSFDTTVIP
jgi:hypothetical protein